VTPDLFRMPVYAATEHKTIASAWLPMLVATAGVVLGTFVGKPLLGAIPEKTYRVVVSAIILALGVWMCFHPGT
jgi:uncharacterized membrane protein YfcA